MIELPVWALVLIILAGQVPWIALAISRWRLRRRWRRAVRDWDLGRLMTRENARRGI